jgi:hypothetical protein
MGEKLPIAHSAPLLAAYEQWSAEMMRPKW